MSFEIGSRMRADIRRHRDHDDGQACSLPTSHARMSHVGVLLHVDLGGKLAQDQHDTTITRVSTSTCVSAKSGAPCSAKSTAEP